MKLNRQSIDLISSPLLLDWKIESIHLSSKFVNRMQSINDGKMNSIKFSWIKNHLLHSQKLG